MDDLGPAVPAPIKPSARELRDQVEAAIQAHERQAYCKRRYFHFEKFCYSYLTDNCVAQFLDKLFSYRQHVHPPLNAATICYAHRKTFCILLILGRGEAIDQFARDYTKSDAHLPFDRDKLRETFGTAEGGDADAWAEAFLHAQYRFLTDILEYDELQYRDQFHVLPFEKREPLNYKSGRATLLKVLVSDEFVGPRLKQKVIHQRELHPQGGYYFVVKQFPESGKDDWITEVKAFRDLQGHSGMIKFFGSWRQVIAVNHLCERQRQELTDKERNQQFVTTYNILLEFGQQDLDEYFSKVNPPVLQQETIKFWRELWSVLGTVKKIHHWQPQGHPYYWKGIHADIKPDNLLWVFEEGRVARLRLADPGLFQRAKDTGKNALMEIVSGTRTYSPPESEQENLLGQLIDVWALGCVFSIAASWIIGGSSFVEAYQRLRQRAASQTTLTGSTFMPDVFHKDKEVLPQIREWHQLLRSKARSTDRATVGMLDIIDDFMLRAKVEERDTAHKLHEKMDKMLREASQHPDELPDLLRECLKDIDEGAEKRSEAAKTPAQSSGSLRQDRKLRKDAIRDQYMKPTAFRTESLKDFSRPHQRHAISAAPVGTLDLPFKQHRPRPSASSSTATHAHRPSLSQTIKSPTSPHSKSRNSMSSNAFPSSRPYEDIFEAMMPNNTRNRMKKDPVLESCVKNRDIIFIIDNAPSMIQHWPEVCMIIDALAFKCREVDNNGMDLEFTNKTQKALNGVQVGRQSWRPFSKNGERPTTKFGEIVIKNEPAPNSRGTDMNKYLPELITRYANGPHIGSEPRYQTVVILTDGLWEETVRKHELQDQIANCMNTIRKNPKLQNLDRPFSIQFIQFGYDQDATELLKKLDNVWPAMQDIIDTEHSTGNIYKMILGSFNSGWDIVDEPATEEYLGELYEDADEDLAFRKM